MSTVRALPTGTVTFLFTDIEGSTKLLQELGEDGYARALREHRRVVRAACERHGGVEVDTQGDAFFVAFPTAPGGLEAAREAQEALAIRVRMGIHTGTPMVTEDGYVGSDVHKAARIAAAGHGGQVLVSGATAALVESEALHDLGEHRLKDLSSPERIFQLGEHEFPPLRTLFRTNLPIPATPFLGREHELRQVGDLIARSDVRLLTLIGPGGTGKTRLALQATAEGAEHYPDGIYWVPLAPLRDPALVLVRAGLAIGAKNGLADHIADKRLLLLLDNFEHVISAADDVEELLAACPNVELLVTSRELLQLPGEQTYPVPPLEPLDGAELFTARAKAVRPDFDPDDAVPELCARLDNLPLALELAAARTRMLSPAQLLERMSGRLDLLKAGRGADPRQQTLRATIEWSYELLEEDEQRLFARLAVFRGGFTLGAAEEVAGAELDLLQSLVDKSLLRMTSDSRFFMLETLREFAVERLLASGEADLLRSRHADWALALATRTEPHLEGRAEQATWLDELEPERDNLRIASATLLERGRAEDALRLSTAIWRLWLMRGPISEGTQLVEAALAAAPDPSPVRPKAHRALGTFRYAAGDWVGAVKHHTDALELSRTIGDEREEAKALLALGASAMARGELEPARQQLETGARLATKVGDHRTTGAALASLGVLALHEADYVRARTLFDDSIVSLGGEEFGTVVNLLNLAIAALRLGDLSEAASKIGESLTLSLRLHDQLSTVHALEVLAAVLAARGDVRLAGRVLGRSAGLRKEEGLSLQELEAELHEETTELVEARLGADEFKRELAAGRQAESDDLISTAIARLD